MTRLPLSGECPACGSHVAIFPGVLGERCGTCYEQGINDPTSNRKHVFDGSARYYGDDQLCMWCLSPERARIHAEALTSSGATARSRRPSDVRDLDHRHAVAKRQTTGPSA